MKYYGDIYGGIISDYKNVETFAFESPYEALDYANKKWQNNPELQVARLLVVKRNDCAENEYAFFQFTDCCACDKFIKYRKKIIWSDNANQIWNGNATMMG